ncbi:Gfo/Idh/MocA family protein [Chondrinema litorale]|uniref:Gfo/Idh/MocA family protein n=1 Tax=Chondrinema litorale TaxID=2994555 RepID=UPI002542AC6D|nr:Gfo/Idh/MocA family oxidoreductase [Chondrinema litorale]UZR93287.1 Gfo/Idh/MocA family oxidoreductase [Chondrinema litorale]
MNTDQNSRRKFIKNISLGSVASIISYPMLSSCATPQQNKDKLGIVLVGLGYYSTDLLAPALQETKHAYLAGIVTGTPEKETIWKEKYGIAEKNVYNYNNFDEIANNPDIDIIYVVLPNSMHAEYTIRAAKAGKHVICEKPMALNVQECESMIKACKENNVALSIGYRMHFEPNTQEVMRIGQEQVLGAVQMVCAGAGYRETRKDHWKLKKAMGGGAMMDMGVYSLQAARYVTGEEPIAVTAQEFRIRKDLFTEVEETLTFQLEFPSGALANLHTSFGMNMNYLDVRTEKGYIKLDPFSSYNNINGSTSEKTLNLPQVNQQATQMDEVAVCIKDGKPLRVTGEEGLKDMKVVDAIYHAVAAGNRISLA